MLVGVISDTHGLLRPEALAALRGCEHIIHAGDIGDAAILASLGEIAQASAVRGNNDRAAWASGIADTEMVQMEAAWIYVIHDLSELHIDPVAAGGPAGVVGHSHKPDTRLPQ